MEACVESSGLCCDGQSSIGWCYYIKASWWQECVWPMHLIPFMVPPLGKLSNTSFVKNKKYIKQHNSINKNKAYNVHSQTTITLHQLLKLWAIQPYPSLPPNICWSLITVKANIEKPITALCYSINKHYETIMISYTWRTVVKCIRVVYTFSIIILISLITYKKFRWMVRQHELWVHDEALTQSVPHNLLQEQVKSFTTHYKLHD